MGGPQKDRIWMFDLPLSYWGMTVQKVDAVPGKFTGRELSPRVKKIEPSGFQQNVRLKILKLAPQEQNLGQPRFWVILKSMISDRKQSRSFVTLLVNAGRHDYLAGISVLCFTSRATTDKLFKKYHL